VNPGGSLLDKVVAVLCNRKNGQIEEMVDFQKGSVEGVGDEKMGDGWRVSEAVQGGLLVVVLIFGGSQPW
jgi:hypothetical protein